MPDSSYAPNPLQDIFFLLDHDDDNDGGDKNFEEKENENYEEKENENYEEKENENYDYVRSH